MKKIIASESKIASIFKISERSVRDKFKDVRLAPGKYDFIGAVEMMVDKFSGQDEISENRKVDTDLKRMKLEIMQGEYHHKDDVSLLVSDMLIRFKAKITAIPTKASLQLLNISNRREIERILKENLNEALEELSEYKELRMEEVDLDGTEDS